MICKECEAKLGAMGGRIFTCQNCGQRMFSRGSVYCHDCSDKLNKCRVCGKDVDADRNVIVTEETVVSPVTKPIETSEVEEVKTKKKTTSKKKKESK